MTVDVYWMDDSILDPFQVKKRMEAIKNMLAKLKEVDLKTFMARVRADCGIDRVTIRKYLEALETSSYIEIKDGVITWKG